jgi:predicted transcriptional regulator
VDHCGASQKAIADFERGVTTRPYRRTIEAIVAAFEGAGVEFTNENGPGVRLTTLLTRSTRSPKIGDPNPSFMTPEQTRAARGWLGWSQTELANRANISLSTVRDFETAQRTPIANNIAAMRRAIEAAGIRLLFDQKGEATGVLRQNTDSDTSI